MHWQRSYHKWLLSILSTLFFLTGCGHGFERIAQESDPSGEYYNSTVIEQMTFEEFCKTVFQNELSEANTVDLHYTLEHPESFGILQKEITLGTISLEDTIQNLDELKDLKAQLLSFDKPKLSSEQQLTYDALLETLTASLLAEGLELYDQPLSPTVGIQAQLPILMAEYSFHSIEDIENYLTLITQFDHYYRELLIFEQQKAAAGLGPSDSTIDAIIQSCESYLIDPEHNFLTETFTSRIADMEASGCILTPQQQTDFATRHVSVIRDHFIPAYQSLIQGLSSLKGTGINEGGLANFKHGKTYYEYLLKHSSGLSYTVPELKTALATRLNHDLEAVQDLFLQYPDLEDRLSTVSFPLTDPNQILEDLKQKMTHDFPSLEHCSYEINYVPSHLEDTLSPAFYLTAPLDNTDLNVIYINNGSEDSTSNLYTTLAHEGFPGHLYQTVYSHTNTTIPLLSILGCSAANEGWATYVENYAWTMDNGLSEGVGEYQALARSISLYIHSLLDIGINYDGWTKDQAADFVRSYFDIDDTTMHQLWQTMIDTPTNYLDYCGGYLEIMEMREQAERTLGKDFSLLEFHQFFLDTGPVPFSVIRNQFQSWLNAQSSFLKS